MLGRKVELTRRTTDGLNGLTVGEKLSHVFYDGAYLGVSLLFVEPKKGKSNTESLFANKQ